VVPVRALARVLRARTAGRKPPPVYGSAAVGHATPTQASALQRTAAPSLAAHATAHWPNSLTGQPALLGQVV
jgi:hypothetical protein